MYGVYIHLTTAFVDDTKRTQQNALNFQSDQSSSPQLFMSFYSVVCRLRISNDIHFTSSVIYTQPFVENPFDDALGTCPTCCRHLGSRQRCILTWVFCFISVVGLWPCQSNLNSALSFQMSLLEFRTSVLPSREEPPLQEVRLGSSFDRF